MRHVIILALLVTCGCLSAPAINDQGGAPPTTQQVIAQRVQQAHDIRASIKLAASDLEVLHNHDAISPADYQTAVTIRDSLYKLCDQLDTAAENNNAVDYGQLLFDLQPQVLDFILTMAKKRSHSDVDTSLLDGNFGSDHQVYCSGGGTCSWA